MIAEISAGYGGLKAAVDIVKGLNAAHTAAQLQEIQITLQRHILDGQRSLSEAGEREATVAKAIKSLEQEIVRLKDWEADKQRYQLADTGQGSLAYRPKEGMENGEPQHWICPNCYQTGQKSILKHEHLAVGRTQTLVCHPCGFDIVTQGLRHAPPTLSRGRR
jgi:hypothetical protein